MLSFLDNKSTNMLWRTRNRVEFADENYAREIMQLFTIGLIKLNNDGTAVRDENGVPLHTYTNDEITEYAKVRILFSHWATTSALYLTIPVFVCFPRKVWTGFRHQIGRGNIETKVQRKFNSC